METAGGGRKQGGGTRCMGRGICDPTINVYGIASASCGELFAKQAK